MKLLSIIIEHFNEKKWIFLMFGVLMGFLGYFMTTIVNIFDMSSMVGILDFVPEDFFELFGGLDVFTSPYGFLNIEVFAFFWIFVGFFVIYVTSSTGVSNEVEDKTIDLILSKPIRRSHYLIGKIAFLYLFIAGVLAVIFAFIGVGIATSHAFIEFGIYWDRLLAVYLINIAFCGTLVMITLLFSTITLDSKKTMGAAFAIMFVMFFLGSFWGLFPEEQQFIKYISTWFYLDTEALFVQGNFDNFLRNIMVLNGVSVSFLAANLLIFRRRDIPV